MAVTLEREFASREALIQYLTAQFPAAAARSLAVSSVRGGRQAAEQQLRQIDPKRYASTRNALNGAVTRLSPYLRHGVLSLAEVRDYALEKVRRPEDAAKLISELGWRDYWQRVYAALGAAIWQDHEPYKTGHAPESYADALPADLVDGTTGMACMDAFSAALRETGWLHNHARMWLAAYVVHWRHVRWQAGARWFLTHLLDGDPASNNLSWQWVASTFSHKPYFFNRDNLARFTDGAYCTGCPLADVGCPLEGSYEQLEQQLFPAMTGAEPAGQPTQRIIGRERTYRRASGKAVVWVHGDNLSPYGPALSTQPDAPAVFVFDDGLLEEWQISLKRLVFLYECLLELPVTIVRGDVAAAVTAFAAQHGAQRVVTSESVSPRFTAQSKVIERAVPVDVLAVEPFVTSGRQLDLTRFSRYWRSVEPQAMQHSHRRQERLL